MHTVIVLSVGFVLLTACALVGHAVNGMAGLVKGMLVFLPLWLVGAGINMYIGVARAGYSVADEAPIFLIVYAIPALIALTLWWRLR